jgi:phage terminase large subunit GpA-like protein
MMDTILRHDVEQVTIQSSAQMSKTEVILNTIGYYISYEPAPMMIVQPTFSMAEAFVKDRVNPMIRDNPMMSAKVRDARARDSGNTLYHKTFPEGHLTIATSQSPSQLAGRVIRLVLADEIDRYPASSGDEGDPISLMKKRQNSFTNRKLICTSTPTIKNYSRIEKEYLSSDQRRFMIPCPHCKMFQEFKFERLKYEEADPKTTTHYLCAHCEKGLDEPDKLKMMDRGRWEAQAPFKGHAGFHINELYSPWKRWHEIVADYLKAKKHDEMLRVFQNTSLGLTYESSVGMRLDWKSLYFANRDSYYIDGRTLLVDDILLITCGVDCQADRLELGAVGYAENKESFFLDYQVILGDTTQPEVWVKLTDYITNTKWTLKSSGAEIPITLTAVDSGYNTQIVYNYCRSKMNKVIPVKGNPYLRASAGLPRQVDITLKKQRVASGVRLFPLGVNVIKGDLFSRLRLERPAPGEPYPSGFCHFPEHFDETFFQGLTSEAMAEEVFHGERRIVFKKNTDVRNEPLDIATYSIGAAEIAGLSRTSAKGWNILRRELGILPPLDESKKDKPKKPKKNMLDGF